ncbi:MAG: hypothetical protein OEM26_19245 [Saprospiraceae bacterium]|nr:hypothetical protein [Saprospiraceae bacterium]
MRHKAIPAILLVFLSSVLLSQDIECVEIPNYDWGNDLYDYSIYEGRHRKLMIPKDCDSLVSMVRIQDLLDYGDIVS